MFKKLMISFLALVGVMGSTHATQYSVQRSDYTFSTVFEMASDNQLVGSIYKSVFHITTHYDIYDNYGVFKGQGICRFFCLGLLYSWGTEIDVYDAEGRYIGMIDGQMASTEPAKFSIYDGLGNRTGIAYLEQNCAAFTIVDPNNSSHILARFSRNFLLDTIDCWDVSIYDPSRISDKILQIFAAFACDTQGQFKPDM